MGGRRPRWRAGGPPRTAGEWWDRAEPSFVCGRAALEPVGVVKINRFRVVRVLSNDRSISKMGKSGFRIASGNLT